MAAMQKYDAVLFDFDGTLANSLDVLEAVYHEFLQLHGVEGSAEEFARLNGPALPEVVELLRQAHDLKPSARDLFSLYTQLLTAKYESVEPFEHAESLLRFVKERQIQCALVTSTYRTLLNGFLQLHQWIQYFDKVVTGDMVEHSKPSPDIYNRALKDLGVEARRSIAIEDSKNGIQAARDAGLVVVAVGEYGVKDLLAVQDELTKLIS